MPRDFKKILCATDFSERSYHAVDYALRFAKISNGTLIFTHIVHVPAGDLMGEQYTLNFAEAEQRARKMLEELQTTRLGGYPHCEIHVEVGDPAEHILKLARERNVDLIVTATHGRSTLASLVMGSVAEKVIRHAPCPVFVVRFGVE